MLKSAPSASDNISLGDHSSPGAAVPWRTDSEADARANEKSPRPTGNSPLDFLQVAFAGHNRTADLGAPEAAAAALAATFRMLKHAGVVQARLLTGMAEGSDLLAASAWRDEGLGPVHAIFPFLHERPAHDLAEAIGSATWLDGETTRALGRNPHLAQTRWLIGAADLLIVLWTGRSARGAGGTADAVRLALEHGVPVLWVRPDGAGPTSLIRPEHLDEDFGFTEFLEELRLGRAPLVRVATPEALRAALVDLGADRGGASPDDELPAEAPRSLPWPWRSYAYFRRILGGRGATFDARPPPEDLRRQKGFARLTLAYAAADALAERLGAVHRSHQVILLAFAILAAAAGSSSALWPELKFAMVIVEAALATGALLVWLDSERGRRHHRWGEARKLAEDLRLERAAWTLGVSTMPHGVNATSSHAAREVRRLAGLAEGAFDRARVAAWGAWTVDELIHAQRAYHEGQTLVNGRISHRVHIIENLSFGILLLTLLGYLGAAIAFRIRGGETPHWLGGLVMMASAVVPAIGAAGLALEATLSLSEQGQRSRVLAERLQALAAALPENPALENLQTVIRAAIRLQRTEEDHWSESASRRRLFRGG